MEIKVYLVDSVLGIPFSETEAFPFSRVHVPAAAASVENDRARKVQKDMSEAIVKRIALKRIENRRREFNCWIRVGRWPLCLNTSKGNVVLGDAAYWCYPALSLKITATHSEVMIGKR